MNNSVYRSLKKFTFSGTTVITISLQKITFYYSYMRVVQMKTAREKKWEDVRNSTCKLKVLFSWDILQLLATLVKLTMLKSKRLFCQRHENFFYFCGFLFQPPSHCYKTFSHARWKFIQVLTVELPRFTE
jgi:hypothetical protein